MILQLTSLDILYLAIAVGFLVLVGFLSYLVKEAVKTLKSLRILLEDIDDTIEGIQNFKNRAKNSILGLGGTIAGLFIKNRTRQK